MARILNHSHGFTQRESRSIIAGMTSIDDETLRFPKFLAKQIGMGVNEISALRGLGCPFYGRKTSIRWVRLFLDKVSGAERLIFNTEFPQCPLTKILERKPDNLQR